MIAAERNYNKNHFPFTANQWKELENQVLTYRYLMSGVPVPPGLMSSVFTTSTSTTTTNSSSSLSLFPHQQPLQIGLGCFQVGYGYGRKIDREPGRCKRTDGKKWRCSKEAHPDSKYCERHMHRGKGKAKKQFDASTTKAVTNINPTTSTTTSSETTFSPYPAISYCSPSQSNYPDKFQANNNATFYPFLSTQSSSNVGLSARDDDISPHWLGLDQLDGELLAQPHKKEFRYSNEVKGAEEGSVLCSETSRVTYTRKPQDIEYNYKIEEQEQHKEVKLEGDKEDESQQKLYHHFLGDWPTKMKTSHGVGLFSGSN